MNEPATTPHPQKRDVRWVFLGSNGIRAGWGFLLFILIYLIVLFLGFRIARPYLVGALHRTVLPLNIAFITEFVQCLPAFLATGIMALIERKPLLSYGYQGKARVLRFFSGLLWGFIALSALVIVLWKSGFLAFDGLQLHGTAICTYALGWGFFFLIVAISEESALRGYLQFTLTRGIGFWWGALLLACLFGLAHGAQAGETKVGLFSAAGAGLFFCFSLWCTGSLWWALGFHAAWDWAQSFFYGTSDSGVVVSGHLLGSHPVGPPLLSGGATGPEGSLLVLGLLVLMAIIMWLWWGRRERSPFSGNGFRPAWSRKPAA